MRPSALSADGSGAFTELIEAVEDSVALTFRAVRTPGGNCHLL